MRKGILLAAVLAMGLVCSPATANTGAGQIQVNTGTTVVVSLFTNQALDLVGWTPVVNSASASFGNIAAYVVCGACTFASVSPTQPTTLYVGQFTVAAGPPIIVYPAWQQNGNYRIVNNFGNALNMTFGCQGGAVTGACLFAIRTIPLSDPVF
ncbi:MAG: hypothetical protein ABI682_11785 [Acidobacteriota bacterium]